MLPLFKHHFVFHSFPPQRTRDKDETAPVTEATAQCIDLLQVSRVDIHPSDDKDMAYQLIIAIDAKPTVPGA